MLHCYKKNIYCVAGNHKNIFNDARVPWSEYRYYDPKTVGLDFEGMISDIKVSSFGLSELFCSLITIWILRRHALFFMNSITLIVIELYSLSLRIWNYYLICIAFHLSGST